MGRATTELPAACLAALRGGQAALLLTPGADGFPAAAFTWAVALDATTVRFGADHDSSALANLQREGRASLQIMADPGLLFLLKGRAFQVKPSMETGRRLGMALWELAVVEVRDQSWPAVRVRSLAYEWAPEHREEMLAVERAVLGEMREPLALSGAVVTGSGRGASFTQVPWAREGFRVLLGADPWPGTLNLRVADPGGFAPWRALAARPGHRLASPDPSSCDARVYAARVAGLMALIVVPEVPGYPEDQIELVAARPLRSDLGLLDGDSVTLLVPGPA